MHFLPIDADMCAHVLVHGNRNLIGCVSVCLLGYVYVVCFCSGWICVSVLGAQPHTDAGGVDYCVGVCRAAELLQ